MTDDNIHRYPDGTWGYGLPNGPLSFTDGDQAMAYFAGLVREVGLAELKAQKAAAK